MSGTGTSRGDFDDGARAEPAPGEAGTSAGMVFAQVAGGTAVTGASGAGGGADIERPDDPLDPDVEQTVRLDSDTNDVDDLNDTDDVEPDDVDSRD